MEEGSPPVALCSPKAENVQEQSEERNIAGGDTVGSIQIEKTDSTNKPSPDSCSDSFDERKGGSGTSSNPATTSEGVEATDSGVKASFDDDTDVQDEEMVLRWDDDELVISEKKSVDSDNLADIECDMEMSCVIKDTSNDGINIGITSSLEPNEYTKSPEKLLHDVSNTGAIDPAATGSRNMLSDLKHDEVKPTLTEDSSAKNDCITAVSNKMETDTTETELGKQDIIVEHPSVNRASQNTENNLTIKENSPTASETIEINKDPVLQLKQDEQNPNSNVISSAEDSMISAPDIQSEKLDPELSIVQDEIIKSPVQDLGKSVLSAAETTDPEKKETENSVTGQVLDIKSPALHQSSNDIPCVSENIEAEKMDVDLNDFDKDSLNVEEKVLAVSDVATKIDSLDSIESKIVNVLNIEDNIKSPEERGPLPENTSLNEATESELLKSPDTSIFNASIEPNLDHKLKNPDVMIEIPTQEMIDYEDSELSFNLNLTSSVESTELDNDNEDIENIKGNVDNILDSLGKDSVFDSKNIVEEVGEKEIMSELKDDSISKNINKAETNIEAGNDEIYVSIATNIPTEVSVASNIDLPEISETNTLNIEPQEMDIQETETKVDAELSIAVIDAITLEPEPSTSKDVKTVEESDAEMNERSEELKEGTKMQDSLGLLAESSRVMEDDDEAEDDDEDGDGDGGDDDDDFEPDDESSNQMTAEHSEDSNAQQSDTDKQTDIQTPGQAGDEVMMDTLDAESKDAVAGSEIVIEDEVVCEDVDISEQTIQLDIESVPEIQTVDEKATPKVESATEKAAVTVSDSNTDSAVKFSLLESLLLRSKDGKEDTSVKTDKPLKMNVVNLEDSSEDDIQEVKKSAIVEKSDTKEEAGDIPKESSESTVSRPRLGLEVFSLDSDEEDTPPAREAPPESVPRRFRCVTAACARRAGGARRLCVECDVRLAGRQASMVSDAMSCTPLLQFLGPEPSSLVEISSSEESETEEPPPLGVDAARVLEEQLADMLNSTWRKYNLEERLAEAVKDITEDLELLEKETQTLDGILDSCQKLTDQLRGDLYATFEPRRQQLPAVIIADTKDSEYTCYESVIENSNERRSMRRRGRTPLEPKDTSIEKMDDDNQDVSVVQLSAEAPPPDLPPAGLAAPPLAEPLAGVSLLALRSAAGAWARAALLQIVSQNGTKMYRVRFGDQRTGKVFTLPGRCVAYIDPPAARLTIGTRIVALFKDIARAGKRETFYAGIVAEIPNPVNKYRYLVFFDDGYAQYVPHGATRLVLHAAAPVWDEVHPYSRQFVREYLMAYPERAMVRMHKGQNLQCEWNGKWWACSVLDVDASLVHVQFLEDGRHEWIYRGSTRLQPLYRERHAAPRRAARRPAKANMPYVEYTRSDEQGARAAGQTPQSEESLRKQRAVAKKSTALPATPATPTGNLDAVTSRVVYYTPKNAVKPHKFVPHTCSPKCRRTDVLSLCELRTYNPLAKPLLSGWQRQVVRFKGHKEVMYVSPCGRRLRSARELHRYLRVTGSELGVDLFAFGASTHCLAEFVLNKCLVAKKDLSHGKENVPVPCVNYYDSTLPEFCSYSTKRAPTAGVPLNLDPGFLCGCDCTDDCQDKSKCACWQMTLEGARTIGLSSHVGYVYRRLPEPLPTGIYECNVRCKCKQTCLNRVAQHPLQLKLQVFKTLNRGWGIRALNDVPKGSFLCVYAGNLLTDATANLDGLNEGDEYLAELDYIEVVEQMKEGYEDDVPDADKERGSDQSSSPSSASEPEERGDADGDFVLPDKTKFRHIEFNKRLRKREKRKTKEDTKKEKDDKTDKDKTSDTKEKRDEDCITISDDEEAREPARFAAEPGMASNEFVSKYRSLRSYFGKDEACYIMDAKVQGNIGRYLNHSCTPNVFVQNVFVDTHDPRFPWVAFFALHAVRAGTELTWNYNYDVGSVPGKVLYCYCGAPNCRGRLL